MLFRRIIVVLTFLVVCACRKEEATFNKFQIMNLSGVTIKILPTTVMADTLILINNDSKKIDLSYQRGLSTGISYASIIDTNFTTVVFNNSDTIIHYFDTLAHTGRYYKPTSNRSFYNTSSYQKQIVDDTKYQRTVTLIYAITKQDYVDAQNK